jgi:hypothetical protein
VPEQRRRPGRPSKLTQETKKRLLQGVQAGLPYGLACSNAGIHYSTLRRWIAKGEEANSGEFREFFDALKRAEAEGAFLHVSNIVRAGNEGHWQASAWMLERRYPEVYGRRVAAEVTGKNDGPVRQEVSHPDPDDKARERERLYKELFAKLDAHRAELDGADASGGGIGEAVAPRP